VTQTKHNNRSWTKGLLVVSLAANLLVAGAVAGMFLSGGPKGGSARFDLTVGPITRAMERTRRDAVRDALRGSGAFRASNRREIRADMDVLIEAVRAEAFDSAAFRAAMSRQRVRLQAGQDALIDAVTAEIEDMSPQERATFADKLSEQLRRGPAGRRSPDGAGPEPRSGG